MKLTEDGKLSIEDSIHKFFPDAPEAWRPIKIKNLMSHTSGLQSEGPAYNNFKIQPDINVIKSAYDLPLVFKPDEKYQYCNFSYFILAEIMIGYCLGRIMLSSSSMIKLHLFGVRNIA